MNNDGPMNLGPKDELIPVKRDTLESLLVAIGMHGPTRGENIRRAHEQERLRRILIQGRDGPPESQMEDALRADGWRQGPRDGRWRAYDGRGELRFGGAFKTENAYARMRVERREAETQRLASI